MSAIKTAIHAFVVSAISDASATQQEINKIKNKNQKHQDVSSMVISDRRRPLLYVVRANINPLRLQYVILRTKSQNRCDYSTYIYKYTDFAIEIWGFYRRLTDTLRYHHTRCSRASGLQLAAILQQVNQRKKSGVYSELSAVFGEFWKITIVGPSSIHRLAWNTTENYMDFLP